MTIRGRSKAKGKSHEKEITHESRSRKDIECYYCGRKGHIKKDCFKWNKEKKAKEKEQDAKNDAKGKVVVIEEVNTICSDLDDGNVLYASTLPNDFFVASHDAYHHD